MFGLFKKKNPGVKVSDIIWISENARWQACIRTYQRHPDTVFLAWFEDSRNKLEQFFRTNNITDAQVKLIGFEGLDYGKQIPIFIEHFPLRQEEQNKFTALGLEEVTVYSALDEPLFQYFTGGKILSLVEKLGVREDEAIEHDMIVTSIRRAQDKIAEKVLVSGNARSQQDWFLNAGMQ
jgi:hypothetical protein